MQPHPSVVIVGGGPAGLSTALFLASAAPELVDRVVVVEKETYPRDKFCAGGLGARADRLLGTIGVRVDVPSVAIDGVSVAFSGGCVQTREGSIGRVVRRIEFDHALERAAESRGITVLAGTKVEGIAVGGSSVRIETTRGPLFADVLVGADGVGSVVRRSLGLPSGRFRAQVIELDTEPLPTDPDRDLLHFDASDPSLTGYAWDFPTLVDGRPLVCRGVYQLKLDDRGVAVDTAPDLRARLAERLAGLGLDIARYRLKRFAERGFELHRPISARRVLLVGEAAGIDPLTGEGIAQAIQYGETAARYLAERVRAGDYEFRDWPRYVARSPVGRDLSLRARLTPHYFGQKRATIERFAIDHPQVFSLGMQHFAGRSLSRLALLRTALFAAWRAVAPGV